MRSIMFLQPTILSQSSPQRPTPKPCVSVDTVRSALSAMEKDSATGQYRAGVRWLLLVANSEHRFHPNLSGLELLAKVVQNLAAGEFSSDVSRMTSPTNLISLGKGGAKIRPMAIILGMRRLITNYLMPVSISEAK